MLPATGDKNHSSGLPLPQLCRHFSLAEIQLATQNFDEELVIGRGGFGKVYRGTINDGSSIVAAIKRLDSRSKQGAPEFWAEIAMLSKLRHCHLVSLIGYCNDQDEMILVYELMPHGTLSDHLHKHKTRLSWLQRLKICIGAARGLDYLHTGTGTHHGVIHRDVKSSNILLDDRWEAKISDFGLSKVGPTNEPSTFVSTAIKGTFGYLDPEYFSTGRLTRKSDVYSFGVVLLEVLCGRRAVDTSPFDEERWGLVGWAQDCIKEGKLEQIIDYSLSGQIVLNCLKEFAQIAERCLHIRPKERPTMAEVVVSLNYALALQETPDYSEHDYSATPAENITVIRKIRKFLFPSIVHGDSSPSRKNGKYDGGTSYNAFSNKDLVVNNDGDISSEVTQSGRFVTPNLKVFTFIDLKKATGNFSPETLLGEGRFGKVFKGWIDKDTYSPSMVGAGMSVAIKKLKADGMQDLSVWQGEVNFLGNYDHSNVINLLGYCKEDQEYLLVYEFMENGSLGNNLFTKDSLKIVPWAVRLKIMIGAARGLAFLHRIDKNIHRNIKGSTILLDGNYNAKLSGFGLARCGPFNGDTHVSTRVVGTNGFAAPEYIATGKEAVQCDVFGFGIVLVETLTGLQWPSVRGGSKLREWARPFERDRSEISKLVDPRLGEEYPREGAIQLGTLALRCLLRVDERPSMHEILKWLEQITTINDEFC